MMASTIRSEEETKEFFDSPEELERKVTQLADWVRQSRHSIVFTVSKHYANNIVYALMWSIDTHLSFIVCREQGSVHQLEVSAATSIRRIYSLISTSSSPAVPDFRSGMNTKLETGRSFSTSFCFLIHGRA